MAVNGLQLYNLLVRLNILHGYDLVILITDINGVYSIA